MLKEFVRLVLRDVRSKSLFEGLEDTFWTSADNKTVTLKDLLKFSENIPAVDLPIEKIKRKILSWGDDPVELEKIERADLRYPILIFVNNDSSVKYIVDGNHRAQKALKNNLSSVKAKLIKFNDLPAEWQKIFGQ